MMARSNSSARLGEADGSPPRCAVAAGLESLLDEPGFMEQAQALVNARAELRKTLELQQGRTRRYFAATFVSKTAAPALATSSSCAALFAPLTPTAPMTWPS